MRSRQLMKMLIAILNQNTNLKKTESQLTKFVVYVLETYSKKRAITFCVSFHRISKLGGKYNRGLTSSGNEICMKDTIVFDEENCITRKMDGLLKMKGEERKVSYKNLYYNSQIHAKNENGFDTRLVSSSLPRDRRLVDILKNGKGTISWKKINGYK